MCVQQRKILYVQKFKYLLKFWRDAFSRRLFFGLPFALFLLHLFTAKLTKQTNYLEKNILIFLFFKQIVPAINFIYLFF